MDELPEFKFLNDEPVSEKESGYFNFYHSFLAPALREIVKSSTSPRTIGLYGPWGTGKSTIIKMLQADKEMKYPIFVFDAWKYQKDSLRRTFLIKFDNFLRTELQIELPKDILNDFYKENGQGSIESVDIPDTRNSKQKIVDFFKKNPVFTLSFLILIIFIVLNVFFGNTSAMKNLQSLWPYLAGFPAIALFGQELIKAITNKLVTDLTTITTGKTRQVIETESTKVLNSPEQFEKRFSKLLAYISTEKAIIVFDNIDRVPGDVAVSMLSTIKTFMEPESESQIISIVPCDPDAINDRVKSVYTDPAEPDANHYAADEYLRKVFNIILWLPNYMATDLEEYTKTKLKETGKISKITNKYDVIIVINAAYRKNPRDIIQFINNLTALVITAYQSGIRDLVIDNIGYLAKVQVIRQKFPKEYKKLQTNWNNPEGIESDIEEYKDFIQATNRITVSDAEPFIFFKDPLSSRNLKNSDGIFNALRSSDDAQFKSLSKLEDKEALTNFTQDMLKKYRLLDPDLSNIYNTQFHGLYTEVPTDQRPQYYHLLASLLDSDLWRSYEKLDTAMTFELINSEHVKPALKRAIINRYLQSTEHKSETDPTLDFELTSKVIEESFKFPILFNKTDINQLSTLVSRYDDLNKHVVEHYKARAAKDKIVNIKSIIQYIESSNANELASTITTISSYSSLTKDNKTMLDVMSSLKTKVDQLVSLENTFTTSTIAVSKALGSFIGSHQGNLKGVDAQSDFDAISNYLIGTISSAPDEMSKADIFRALWWAEGHCSPTLQATIKDQLNSFIQTTTPEGFKQFFNGWSDGYKVTLLEDSLKDSVLIRSLNNPPITSLVHSYYITRNDKKADEYLRYVIANSSVNPQNDTLFINNAKRIYEPSLILDSLLAKLRSGNASDESYIPALNKLVPKNGRIALKESLQNYISHLIKQSDSVSIQNAEKYIEQLIGISKQHRQTILRDLIDELKVSPFPLPQYVLQQIQIILKNSSSLETSDINSVYTLLSSNFSNQLDQTASETTINLLLMVSDFNYRNQTGLITTMFNSISAWSDPILRDFALEKLKTFKSSRAIVGEKAFWQSVDNIISP